MQTQATPSAGYLRKAEASQYLSISLRTLTEWTRKGLLPVHKPCRKVVLYAVRDLDAAMNRFRVEAVGE
jgi:excisionase family DNA binding protein